MRRGVLVVAFGGPRDEDEVEEFLTTLRGEPPPQSLVQEVTERYRIIGGSPFYAILERIIQGMRRRIRGVEISYGVLYGRPRIEEAMEDLEREGALEILIFPLSPYRSPYWEEALKRARGKATELILELKLPSPWSSHPEYVSLWATRIREELLRLGRTPILFTAHSVPEGSSGDYVMDLEGTIRAIMGLLPDLPWRLGFHGCRSGWIGPGLKDALRDLKEGQGAQRVLVVPVGFVCDHLETLYDLDVELKDEADSQGIILERIPCLNASEDFLNFLVKRVYEALK